MPRAVRRRFLEFYNTLKAIAQDKTLKPALRLRAVELALATRTENWELATGSLVVMQSLRALAATDKQLLVRMEQVADDQRRIAEAIETPEQKRQREVDELLAKAEQERKQNENDKTD